jgi:sugar lactone lactonase YvrE
MMAKGRDLMVSQARWLRREDGRAVHRLLAAIVVAGALVLLTATGAATAAAVSPGTLRLLPGHATAGDRADVFVFKYTASAHPVPGTISVTVPSGFSTPQDISAGTAGYLSIRSSCALFQISGITTNNGAATVTLAVNCAAAGDGTLAYRDVTVPTAAGTYPFAASFTPSDSQSPIAFNAQQSVTVRHGPLASFTLSPATATIMSGGSQTYTAQGFDAYGNTLGNITSTTRFKIYPDGRCAAATCTATNPGPHIVTGTSHKTSTTAALTVTAPAAARLYWSSFTGGTVSEASLDGTSPQTMIIGQNYPAGMAVYGSHIYWIDKGNGTINQADLEGTHGQTIITVPYFPIGPVGLAVDSSGIYWTNQGPGMVSGTVNEANLDGTNPHTIITGQDNPNGVAIKSSHIYWTDTGSGTISEASLDGADPHTIVASQAGPSGLAVYGSRVYWTDTGSGTISVADLDGADPHTILAAQVYPQGLAIGSSHIYWTNQGNSTPSGTINEANLNGTDPRTIVASQYYPFGIAVGPSQEVSHIRRTTVVPAAVQSLVAQVHLSDTGLCDRS